MFKRKNLIDMGGMLLALIISGFVVSVIANSFIQSSDSIPLSPLSDLDESSEEAAITHKINTLLELDDLTPDSISQFILTNFVSDNWTSHKLRNAKNIESMSTDADYLTVVYNVNTSSDNGFLDTPSYEPEIMTYQIGERNAECLNDLYHSVKQQEITNKKINKIKNIMVLVVDLIILGIGFYYINRSRY